MDSVKPTTGGHQMFDTREEAVAMRERHPSLLMYATTGDFIVDDRFLSTVRWMTAKEGGTRNL